tara:strand:+ start:1083 stop:3848 length:2766 start_codon:yes stop_codon:yes gene_type:complete
MTAVAQTYSNYLGGLNEQPDEVKKPGQLVNAVNVMPDATNGLLRRKGFEHIPWKNSNGTVVSTLDADPDGTWFELDYKNPVNEDYLYFGCAKKDGSISIFNQDGEQQAVRYTNEAVIPHKNYLYNSGLLEVSDDNGDLIQSVNTNVTNNNGYFRNTPEIPLKYCVSKDQVIFTNPKEMPTLAQAMIPTTQEATKYYSFVNLKVIDPANYDYVFRRFYGDTQVQTYNYIKSIELDAVGDLGDGYDEDLTLPLQTNGPFRFTITPPGGTTGTANESAIVDVTFRGQIVQLQSSDSGGYRNEARYSWSVRVINPGKGFNTGTFTETLSAPTGDPEITLPNLTLTFSVKEVNKVIGTANQQVTPQNITSSSSADDILQALATDFKNKGIDKVLIVGSGIYLENSDAFSVSTQELAVADVINSQKLPDDLAPIVRVNTVAELPIECYAGFVVEINNSFDEKNNYYLEYVSESQSDIGAQATTLSSPVFTKADGYWKEVAKPFEQTTPNNGTLPHMITIARETDQTRFAFIVSPMMYRSRTAGTANDNPSLFVDDSYITEVNYYKNRLFFMTSEGTVVSSAAGEIDNLFLSTAIEVSPIDPIDLIANSNQKVAIHGSSVVNNAMVLFGDTEQYSLATNESLLTSQTASITKISNYTFDSVSNPIYLGTNLGFISKGVKKFYEMTNIYDRGPIDINERSQQITTLMAEGFNMPVSSREQSQVLIYKKNAGAGSNELLVYRFRQENSQESSQTAWVKWTVPDSICHISLPQDKAFVVTRSTEGVFKLLKLDPKSTPNYMDAYNTDATGVTYESRIEFPTIYPRGESSSDATANLTIHRVKMSTADIGAYNVLIGRLGYDDYNLLVEQTPADSYDSNAAPILYKERVETIPIYTKNNNLTLVMSTTFNAPLVLRSMTWEGDYNQPYYKRV